MNGAPTCKHTIKIYGHKRSTLPIFLTEYYRHQQSALCFSQNSLHYSPNESASSQREMPHYKYMVKVKVKFSPLQAMEALRVVRG
jgi:hypothetical protein